MKWSRLIGSLVAALGIGILCCCASHSFGIRPPHIRNALDLWPQQSFLALDLLAGLLLALSYFLARARNWARLLLMGGCFSYIVLAFIGAVWLCVEDANIVDGVFIAGVFILSIAGPLLLVLILRQPDVIGEFGGRMPTNRLQATPGSRLG
jgi:hypothetical protein